MFPVKKLSGAISLIEDVAQRNGGHICVAYSGGKDSLAVMELVSKVVPKFTAFNFFICPDLPYLENQLEFAKKRWPVNIVSYPSDGFFQAQQYGTFCHPQLPLAKYKTRTLAEMYMTGLIYLYNRIDMPVMTGMKDADGLPRRQFFSNIKMGGNPFWENVYHPLRNWSKQDVLNYLRISKIPLPNSETKGVTNGVGLGQDALCWLYKEQKESFDAMEKWFPFIKAAVKRREFYGI